MGMVWKQTATISEALFGQVLGKEAVSIVNTYDYVTNGTKVASSLENKEAFTQALGDLVHKQIFSARAYENIESAHLVRDEQDWNVIIQKVRGKMPQPQEDPAFMIGDPQFEPEKYLAPVYKMELTNKLFTSVGTVMFGYTMPDDLYRPALLDMNKMGSIYDIFATNWNNRQIVELQNQIRTIRATLIAYKFHNNNENALVDLLKDFNDEFRSGEGATKLTHDEAIAFTNPEFTNYFLYRLYIDAKQLHRIDERFGDEEMENFTPKEYLYCDVNERVMGKIRFFVEPYVYNLDKLNTEINLNEIGYWQGVSDPYKISVNIKDDNNETVAVTQDSVIAVMYDIEAMGVSFYNKKVKTTYHDIAEYTTYVGKLRLGGFVDLSENVKVYYIGPDET